MRGVNTQKVVLFEVGGDVLGRVAKSLNYPSVQALKNDVFVLKEWMKTQPHLPEIMAEKMIENFLILNKGSIELTKEKIDMYYTVRSHLPEVFDESNPKLPEMRQIVDAVHVVALPKLTKEMFRVSFSKIRNTELMEKIDFNKVIAHLVNCQEIRLSEDVAFGDIFIVDAADASFNLMLKFTPSILYKTLILIYERLFSMRLKAVYVFNAPPFVEKIVTIVKGFIKPKMFDRIHIYPDSSFLLKCFDKEQIPSDYGGEEKSLCELQELGKLKRVEYQERFDKLDNLRVNEKLRPEKLINDENLGFYGNFKKLEID
ncbi:uncharacterized protein LOC123016249 [Tribolium madens]|uniref:uncharacterized protein LOC123016249 n=1 Tax=Tribolium madens TaxID=41895 RepID=UPI001CF724CA|nr:uncharacterized protein LOC123016249 [Tribolium madens]